MAKKKLKTAMDEVSEIVRNDELNKVLQYI
jgi:hypothetical protein